MKQYTQLVFDNISGEKKDILLGLLSVLDTQGFEEGDDNLKVVFASDGYPAEEVAAIAAQVDAVYTTVTIEEENWNQVWESNFQPVIIERFAAIRADFHEPITGVQHEIIITPKMSFGTGHHATTYMMMQQMEHIDFSGRSVFDFGTGTGVLAILAHKLGASAVTAIDNDDWSINNAKENMLNNEAPGIELFKADEPPAGRCFDVILANINKHVILATLPALASMLAAGGTLLLSGLMTADETDIREAATREGLRVEALITRHNWLCFRVSGGRVD